jgi:hypothetical protein
MKTLNKLKLMLIAFVSILSISAASAQCQASFTYVDNGNGSFSFNNTSTGNFLSYYWTLGDGNNSWATNSSNTYAANGGYEVCLSIFDSISQCQSTICDSIFVSGLSQCNLNQPWYFDSICNFYFIANNNGSSYFWDFGDGNTSTQQDPVHNYTNNGWYYYCLTVDSCAPICDSIFVNCLTNPCSLNQPWYFDSICNFYFIANNSGSSYFWDFGDGNISTLQDPVHNYANSNNGWYYYCLTVDSCAPICDSIYINCSVTNVSDNIPNNATEISIYPNPIRNRATVEFNLKNTKNIQIFITNIVGRKVKDISIDNLQVGRNSIQWEAGNLPNGVYLLNIQSEGSIKVKKLILN